ncbi:MAG: hypothetical protein QOF49_233 [Chloroflexota bacterium]|jgi:hypothetical protein|nr:hypothetical protein [Chloroflexota bacterium]
MHPVRYPRYAALAGIIFVGAAVVYFVVPTVFHGHVDFAGITMLAVLGIAMALMAYVLFAGSSSD